MRSKVFVLLGIVLALMAAAVQPGVIRAQRENTLSVAFTQEPDSLNPMYSTQDFAGLARSLFLAAPWHFDDQLKLVPVLVKEIPSVENGGISADGKTITLKLREDAVWSDGTPITSDDYMFTAEMYASDRNSPLGRTPWDTAQVTAPDKTTVVVTFSEPFAPWPVRLFGRILPAHVLRPVFEAEGTLDKAAWNSTPTVASGPYTLKEYQKGQFMIFAANDKFVLGKPKIEQILIKIVPDDAGQVASLKSGESDIGYFLAPADAVDLKQNFPIEIYTVNAGYNEGWFFNLNAEKGHPAIQDAAVRKAISMAINRQELVTGLLNDLVKPSAGFWDGSPYQDPSIQPQAYDPEGAKKLLDEAGWAAGDDGIREKGGVKLRLRYATNSRDLRKDAQRVIEEQLKQVGVAVELINHPNKIFLAAYENEGPVARGDFDVAQWSISPRFPDPDTTRFRLGEIGTADNGYVGSNWAHVRDDALEALFVEQEKTVDFAARTALFHQISKIVNDRTYWMGLWQDPDLWAVSKRVSGVRFSGGTPWWNVTEWELK
jgi:peptide/nickel transport system substrate-binding protein